MKVVTRKIIPKPIAKIHRVVTLKDFHELRRKVLIIRSVGGLGDILMHRMMFEDFKRVAPDIEVHFACPYQYHDAVKDHPYIDKVLNSADVNRTDYVLCYNTSTACGAYEMKIAPQSGMNRSDIWAAHCGLTLQHHNMHISLTEEEQAWGREQIKALSPEKPVVLISAVSAMDSKNLQPNQLEGLVKGLEERGCTPIGIHTVPVPWFTKNGVPLLHGHSIRRWMALIHAAHYVVSVDSAAFHCAGGMGRPLVGVYTWADGQVYGKHYDFFLVQRHRNLDPNWTCGPCYNWCECPKTKATLKPCLTEITPELILSAVDKMRDKWPASLY